MALVAVNGLIADPPGMSDEAFIGAPGASLQDHPAAAVEVTIAATPPSRGAKVTPTCSHAVVGKCGGGGGREVWWWWWSGSVVVVVLVVVVVVSGCVRGVGVGVGGDGVG
jgi:hypothetical protein